MKFIKISVLLFIFLLGNESILNAKVHIKHYRSHTTHKNNSRQVELHIDWIELVISAVMSAGIPILSNIVSLFKKSWDLHERIVGFANETFKDPKSPFACNKEGLKKFFEAKNLESVAIAKEKVKISSSKISKAALLIGDDTNVEFPRAACTAMKIKLRQSKKQAESDIELAKKIETYVKDYTEILKNKMSVLPDNLVGVFTRLKIAVPTDQKSMISVLENQVLVNTKEIINVNTEGLAKLDGPDFKPFVTENIIDGFSNDQDVKMKCSRLPEKVDTDNNVGFVTKMLSFVKTIGFMNTCTTVNASPSGKFDLFLGIAGTVSSVALIIAGNAADVLTFGAFKIITVAIYSVQLLFALVKAYSAKNDSKWVVMSQQLGSALGYCVKIILSVLGIYTISFSRRLKKMRRFRKIK